MLKHPIALVFVAFVLAAAVNVYFYSTGVDLTTVVSRTLFADTLIVLSLVPISESVRIGQLNAMPELNSRLKAGMKSVTLYTFLLAILTYFLLSFFGEPLIAERLNVLEEMLNAGIADGQITDEQKIQQIELANQIYSPSSQVLIVIMANLFVGFISSILAAVLIRK